MLERDSLYMIYVSNIQPEIHLTITIIITKIYRYETKSAFKSALFVFKNWETNQNELTDSVTDAVLI